MKSVIAFIKSHKLSNIVLALQELKGHSEPSVTDVKGFGQRRAENPAVAVASYSVNNLNWFRIEVACPDSLVDDLVSIIQKCAASGLRGDGNIYVSPIEQSIRISTPGTGNAELIAAHPTSASHYPEIAR